MEEEKVPFLCGGVFFFVLKQAVYPDGTARDHQGGISDEHSDPIVMRDLIYAFTGSRGYGTSKDTSNYKNCLSEGGKNIPFNKKPLTSSYDYEVRNEYKKALRRMCEFAEWHLDPRRKVWLVKALLDVIEHDADIAGTDEFCIGEEGSFVSKDKMLEESSFVLQPFLIGVLNFILQERAGHNRSGKPTLDANSDQAFRSEREYNGKLGEDIARPIKVEWCEMPSEVVPDVIDEKTTGSEWKDGRSDDEVITDNLVKGISGFAEVLETQKHQMAETIRLNSQKNHQEEDPDASSDSGRKSSDHTENNTTVIQHQTNVVQNGDNNINVTNNGTMNFNF